MNLKTILRTRKFKDSVFLRKDKDRNDGTYRGVAGTQVFESYGKKYVEFHDVLFDYDDLEAYLKNQFVESYDDLSNQDFEDFANMDAISALYSVEPSNDDFFEDDDYYGEDLVEEAEYVSDSVDDDIDEEDERTSLWSRTYNKIVNFAINNDMINVPIEVDTEDIKSIKVDDEGYITVITQYGDEDFIENYDDDVMFVIYNKVTNA